MPPRGRRARRKQTLSGGTRRCARLGYDTGAMRKSLIIAIIACLMSTSVNAKSYTRGSARAQPRTQIACTVLGCAPVPPGCVPRPGYTWSGLPSGFDVIVCRPGAPAVARMSLKRVHARLRRARPPVSTRPINKGMARPLTSASGANVASGGSVAANGANTRRRASRSWSRGRSIRRPR